VDGDDKMLIAAMPSLHLQLHDLTAAEIATEVEELVALAFQTIPFTDIVEHVRSPESDIQSVSAFMWWSECLKVVLDRAFLSVEDVEAIYSLQKVSLMFLH